MSRCEIQEGGPVWSIGVASRVLPESDIALGQAGLDRGELDHSHVLLAEQPVNRTRAYSSQEGALGVDPTVTFASRPH